MGVKDTLVTLIEYLTDSHIYRVLPRGLDLRHDIANSLLTYQVGTIFDIGANVGQSAQAYLSWCPNARIYCFEPVSSTFRQLQENLKDNDRVHCFQLALGSSERRETIVLQGSSDMFFMPSQLKDRSLDQNMATEDVQVITLDRFCRSKRIDRIDYLKIDTEGADLDVLKGADSMLTEQRIDLVQVEAGMNNRNERHVPLEALNDYLQAHEYFLFGIYEQVTEWPTKEPHLRRTNLAFISRRMIEANKG